MGLFINAAKTKVMILRGEHYLTTSINNFQWKNFKRVKHFNYLVCYCTEQLDPDMEIKCRIVAARKFLKLKALLRSDNINLNLWQRSVKCYIWSVVLYGAETWTIKAPPVGSFRKSQCKVSAEDRHYGLGI